MEYETAIDVVITDKDNTITNNFSIRLSIKHDTINIMKRCKNLASKLCERGGKIYINKWFKGNIIGKITITRN